MAIERGVLALADITGYTSYLSGVELDHSQDILADLLGTVVRSLTGRMKLAKLEGDAVFVYWPDAERSSNDASDLVTLVEGCYFAFQERQRNIQHLTTCTCDACLRIPTLSLKFLVHHGQFLLHDVMGSRELLGPDVILAHRLLKNRVTETTGLRGYAMFTTACLEEFAMDPAALGMRSHAEDYEDIGPVSAAIHDLQARWQQEQDRVSVRVEAADAALDVEVEISAPPPIVWEFLANPIRRVMWQPAVVRVDEDTDGGVRGVGTTNHCVHGDGEAITEQIVDWKPFRYFTLRSISAIGVALFTAELIPDEDGSTTRLSYRMRPVEVNEGVVLDAVLPMFRTMMEMGFGTLAAQVAEAVAAPA